MALVPLNRDYGRDFLRQSHELINTHVPPVRRFPAKQRFIKNNRVTVGLHIPVPVGYGLHVFVCGLGFIKTHKPMLGCQKVHGITRRGRGLGHACKALKLLEHASRCFAQAHGLFG